MTDEEVSRGRPNQLSSTVRDLVNGHNALVERVNRELDAANQWFRDIEADIKALASHIDNLWQVIELLAEHAAPSPLESKARESLEKAKQEWHKRHR